MARASFHPLAERELIDAAQYYELESPGLGGLFTLRCDAPAFRRFLEMTISEAPDGSVEFETHLMRGEEREPVDLLSRKMTRSTRLLRSCAWCNRIDVGYGSND